MTPPKAIEEAREALAHETGLIAACCDMFDQAIVSMDPPDELLIRVQEIRESATRASRALAALNEVAKRQAMDDLLAMDGEEYETAPVVSGLTEEERAEGRRLREAWACGDENSREHFGDWLLEHAEALLSPAPSIDWKRVGEIRKRHEVEMRTAIEWTPDRAQVAHADRATLLSELAKMGGGE